MSDDVLSRYDDAQGELKQALSEFDVAVKQAKRAIMEENEKLEKAIQEQLLAKIKGNPL